MLKFCQQLQQLEAKSPVTRQNKSSIIPPRCSRRLLRLDPIMADPAQQQPPQQQSPLPQQNQQAQPQAQLNANQLQVLQQVQQLLLNAGINAVAVGGQGGQPPAIPFAITPGQVDVSQVIDYSSKGGKSLYTYTVTQVRPETLRNCSLCSTTLGKGKRNGLVSWGTEHLQLQRHWTEHRPPHRIRSHSGERPNSSM